VMTQYLTEPPASQPRLDQGASGQRSITQYLH
jgi:hypothetical protein